MDNLLTTIGVAFVFIALAIAALAIGWLITGKNKIKGSCGGKRPGSKEDCDSTQSSCGLCGKKNGDDNEP